MIYLNDEKIVNGRKVYKYLVDTEADLNLLPTNIGISSTALIFDSGLLAFLIKENGTEVWGVPAWMR